MYTSGEAHFISVPNIFNNKGQTRSLYLFSIGLDAQQNQCLHTLSDSSVV